MTSSQQLRLIHREVVQLVVLIALAVLGFFVTRAVAKSNNEMRLRDAAEWYDRGLRELDSDHLEAAIDAFRRAAVRNQHERKYMLMLARALARHDDNDAARGVLMTMRETAPEDPVINLALARLASSRGAFDEAVRFYHNALYAPWPPGHDDERRDVRLELARVLLAHNQGGRALPELMALSSEASTDPAKQLELADMFTRVGDRAHALEQYERALARHPDNRQALGGAGEAAFQIGDYRRASTYLHRLGPDAGDYARTRAVVDFVLSNDPLAARLGPAERVRRLRLDLSSAAQRLGQCVAIRRRDPADAADTQLQNDLAALQHQLKARAAPEQDVIDASIGAIERVVRRVTDTCGPPTPIDDALLLIVRRHRSDPS